ncbi:unnamed protein product [Orchesella dallaii]|uniref:Uncharacterized protein n=1 Tax=Orchesella dallaii TaxID=48710 RepID=A0ABP1R1V2_9HEXA
MVLANLVPHMYNLPPPRPPYKQLTLLSLVMLNRVKAAFRTNSTEDNNHTPLNQSSAPPNHVTPPNIQPTPLFPSSRQDSVLRRTSTSQPNQDSVLRRTSTLQPNQDSVLRRTSTLQPNQDSVLRRTSTLQPNQDSVLRRTSTSQPNQDSVLRRTSTSQPTQDSLVCRTATAPTSEYSEYSNTRQASQSLSAGTSPRSFTNLNLTNPNPSLHSFKNQTLRSIPEPNVESFDEEDSDSEASNRTVIPAPIPKPRPGPSRMQYTPPRQPRLTHHQLLHQAATLQLQTSHPNFNRTLLRRNTTQALTSTPAQIAHLNPPENISSIFNSHNNTNSNPFTSTESLANSSTTLPTIDQSNNSTTETFATADEETFQTSGDNTSSSASTSHSTTRSNTPTTQLVIASTDNYPQSTTLFTNSTFSQEQQRNTTLSQTRPSDTTASQEQQSTSTFSQTQPSDTTASQEQQSNTTLSQTRPSTSTARQEQQSNPTSTQRQHYISTSNQEQPYNSTSRQGQHNIYTSETTPDLNPN